MSRALMEVPGPVLNISRDLCVLCTVLQLTFYYYSHFTGEETERQRGLVTNTCLRSRGGK